MAFVGRLTIFPAGLTILVKLVFIYFSQVPRQRY